MAQQENYPVLKPSPEAVKAIRQDLEALSLQQGVDFHFAFEGDQYDNEEIGLYRYMFDVIVLSDWGHDNDPFSPTPGDPYAVMNEDMETYHGSALAYMLDLLDVAKETHGLTDAQYQAIKNEIQLQHDIQCDHNDQSSHRLHALYRQARDRFDSDNAHIIRRVRSGEADSLERILLLKEFPEVDSIEDMKLTSPLDVKSHRLAQEEYYKQLINLNANPDAGFIVQMIPHDQQELVPKITGETTADQIKIVKTVIAKIFFADRTSPIEVVEKRSYFDFSNEVDRPHGTDTVPVQPISVSTYLRVERNRDKTGDALPPVFDVTNMLYVNGAERKEIPRSE